jgi:hypothetical protein
VWLTPCIFIFFKFFNMGDIAFRVSCLVCATRGADALSFEAVPVHIVTRVVILGVRRLTGGRACPLRRARIGRTRHIL